MFKKAKKKLNKTFDNLKAKFCIKKKKRLYRLLPFNLAKPLYLKILHSQPYKLS